MAFLLWRCDFAGAAVMPGDQAVRSDAMESVWQCCGALRTASRTLLATFKSACNRNETVNSGTAAPTAAVQRLESVGLLRESVYALEATWRYGR
jgi:hypothetical protein